MQQPAFIGRLYFAYFVTALLLAGNHCLAQPPRISFKKINIENGLSNSTIETIFQDSRGFMWFGTRDGLNRFDGYQMLVFKYNAADSNSVSDSYITCIYEDEAHQLWVGTLNGLNRFNPATNSFTRYYHQPFNKNSPVHNHITQILNAGHQKIWLSTLGGGISQLDIAHRQFTPVPLQAAGPGTNLHLQVYSMLKDSKGNYWAGTEAGLYLYNSHTGFIPAPLGEGQLTARYLSVRAIAEQNNNTLLLGTSDNGLIQYNTRYRTRQWYTHDANNPYSISSNLLRAIHTSKQGHIWTGTVNGGLDFFDTSTKQFFNYQYQPDNPASLSQRTVSAIYEDRQGNIWIGTHRGGINLYMPGIEKFNLYQQRPTANSLSYNDVKCFCEDARGNIWIGTDGGGLNVFNHKQGSFKHYKYNHQDEKSIGSNEVIDITQDSEGNIWIGTWGGGLCRYNASSNNFTRYRQNGNQPAPRYIQNIFEDSKQNLWIATYFDGLYLFNKKNNTWAKQLKSPSGSTALAGKNILSLAQDKQGNIWIGTDDGGLNRLDALTKEYSHYFNPDDKKPDIRVLYVDSKGTVWVGQSGLYQYQPASNRFVLYQNTAALNREFIKGIAEDNGGNFWISSSNGIGVLNPANNSFRKYNSADGLQGLEFEANAVLKTNDGQLFFGGINGFNAFYPNEIISNAYIPPVFITDLQVNNKPVLGGGQHLYLKQDISFTQQLTLPYTDATFSFGFAALNYTVSENNQYAYKLQGWDKEWINAGNNTRASYSNVSPGTYTFYIKASNNDGVWNDKGARITVTILPPFWQTWWFKTILLLTAAIAIIYWYRFKQKLAIQRFEEKKKEELHQLQLQFFTNISHEFRTPLSLIAGPIEKLIKENPASGNSHTYRVIQKNTNRLLQLINELMDFRKTASGILQLQVMPGNIPIFLQELSEEFSEMALQKNIHFNIASNYNGAHTWFDRQVLEKIIINLLSNSFKYTPNNGSVTLEVLDTLKHFTPLFSHQLFINNDYKAQQYIYFRVADNGPGISEDSLPHLFERYYRVSDNHLGSGIGLAFVKSLAQLHKGLIYVYSEKNKGTEIIIGIPCQKTDYTHLEKWPEDNSRRLKLESLTPVTVSHVPALLPAENQVQPPTLLHSILIAEDNDELRQFLTEILAPQYRITEAINGKEALNKMQDQLPDIIISDIMMPVMDGISFCRLVKTSVETSHIPFIMLTAKDGTEARIEGAETGADYYFSKP
ncbi:MAG: hypothetical protein RL172_1442, partial [Bacteroidota bacterium]